MTDQHATQRKPRASSGPDQETGTREMGSGVVDGNVGTIAVHTAVTMKEDTRPVEITAESEERGNGFQDRDDDTEASVDHVRVKDLKLLWRLFQCFWPVVLNIFCVDVTMPRLIAPYALTLWLAAYAVRGNILNQFGPWDFSPSVLWIAVSIFERDLLDGAGILLLLLLVLTCLMGIVLGPRKAWELGPRRTCQRLSIQLSGKCDAFERWLTHTCLPESFPREEDYEDDKEHAEEDIKIHNLEYLENLSKRGELKRPNWVLAALGLLILWQVGFLFVVHSTWLEVAQGQLLTFNHDHRRRNKGAMERERFANGFDDRFEERWRRKGKIGAPNTRETTLYQLDEDTGEAVALTKETFEDFTGNRTAVLVQFCTRWTVFCLKLRHTLERFAEQARNRQGETLGVGIVSCVTDSDFCQDPNAESFPTLRWYEYEGDRSFDAVMRYATRRGGLRAGEAAHFGETTGHGKDRHGGAGSESESREFEEEHASLPDGGDGRRFPRGGEGSEDRPGGQRGRRGGGRFGARKPREDDTSEEEPSEDSHAFARGEPLRVPE